MGRGTRWYASITCTQRNTYITDEYAGAPDGPLLSLADLVGALDGMLLSLLSGQGHPTEQDGVRLSLAEWAGASDGTLLSQAKWAGASDGMVLSLADLAGAPDGMVLLNIYCQMAGKICRANHEFI